MTYVFDRAFVNSQSINKIASLEKLAVGNSIAGKKFIERAMRNRADRLHQLAQEYLVKNKINPERFTRSDAYNVLDNFAKERSLATGININPERYNTWVDNAIKYNKDIPTNSNLRSIDIKEMYPSTPNLVRRKYPLSSYANLANPNPKQLEFHWDK